MVVDCRKKKKKWDLVQMQCLISWRPVLWPQSLVALEPHVDEVLCRTDTGLAYGLIWLLWQPGSQVINWLDSQSWSGLLIFAWSHWSWLPRGRWCSQWDHLEWSSHTDLRHAFDYGLGNASSNPVPCNLYQSSCWLSNFLDLAATFPHEGATLAVWHHHTQDPLVNF